MFLTDMTVKAFTEKLSSNAPAPGGGGAAALSGALGAALVSMVCNLTLGKPKYAEYEAFIKETLARSDKLVTDLLDAVQSDADAFDSVIAAFGMPKETDEQKTLRADAIQNACKTAIASPEAAAGYCMAVMKLVESLLGKSNVNVASDLAVGATQAHAGLKGALANVRVNLPLMKDPLYVAEKKSLAERLEKDAALLLQTIEKGVADLVG